MSTFTKIATVAAILLAATCLWTNITQGSGTCDILGSVIDLFQGVLCSVTMLIVWIIWALASIVVGLISSIFGTNVSIPQPNISCS